MTLSVVRLSLRDTAASVSPNRLSALFRVLIGRARPNPLADPRLEALRRYAVLYRVSDGLIDRDAEAACLALGCTQALLCQVEALIKSAVPRLGKGVGWSSVRFLALGVPVGAVLLLSALFWLSAVLDDGAVASILTCLCAVLMLSLAAGRGTRPDRPRGTA